MSTILHINGTIIFKFVQEKDQQPQSLSKSGKQNFTTAQIFNYFGQIQFYGKLLFKHTTDPFTTVTFQCWRRLRNVSLS